MQKLRSLLKQRSHEAWASKFALRNVKLERMFQCDSYAWHSCVLSVLALSLNVLTVRYGYQLEFPDEPPPFELRLHCDAFHVLLLRLRSKEWSRIYKVMLMRSSSLSHRYTKAYKYHLRYAEQAALIVISAAGIAANAYLDLSSWPLYLLLSVSTSFAIGLLFGASRRSSSDPGPNYVAMFGFIELILLMAVHIHRDTTATRVGWFTKLSGVCALGQAMFARDFVGSLVMTVIAAAAGTLHSIVVVGTCFSLLGLVTRYPKATSPIDP